ncbi:transposase family protein [Kitasatospora sp. NPDC056446]|uniref:transposase family protein n=1 Tax=Kitasatospora sp. NPDC056446 TaxID=3345819 RepID=UPI0036A27EEE
MGHSCPGCGDWSARVHSSYLRLPVDGPVGGRRVRLSSRVRHFVCGNPSFGQRTFAEQIEGLTRRHGRWTEQLRATLASVGAGRRRDPPAGGPAARPERRRTWRPGRRRSP